MKDRFGCDWSRRTGTRFWRLPHIGRRTFFKHMATALTGYFLVPGRRPGDNVARAGVRPIAKAKNVILVILAGAPSHTDTFDLKEGPWTPAYMAPATFGDIRFPRGLMPNLANHLDSIAFVRSARAHATVHSLAQNWIQIGRNPQGLNHIAPHIGSVVALELGPQSPDCTLPAFISVNSSSLPGAGFLGSEVEPFYISTDGVDNRSIDHAVSLDNIFNFDQNTRHVYGNSNFGNACVCARNLLRANMGTRFIQISFGSWDHHGNIYAPNANLQLLSRQFDAGLAALIADLKQDGTLNQTLIVAMGEFGRTAGPLNQNAGRDHHQQHSVLFAGGGVKGNRAIGQTNALGDDVADPGWSAGRYVWPEDVEATIYSALGIDWTKIVHGDNLGPGFEYVPQQDLYQYQPVNELWP